MADTKTDVKPAAQEAPNPRVVRVGVAAIIRRGDGRIVVGKRISSHGAGSWQLPGGHLEYGEEMADCAVRETLEETGLKVQAKGILYVTNDVFRDVEKHYITIFIKCELEDDKAEPKPMEPTKCEEWRWKTWDEIRAMPKEGEKLFIPLEQLIDQVGTERLETLNVLPSRQ